VDVHEGEPPSRLDNGEVIMNGLVNSYAIRIEKSEPIKSNNEKHIAWFIWTQKLDMNCTSGTRRVGRIVLHVGKSFTASSCRLMASTTRM